MYEETKHILYRPISASVATVAMRELEYNLQLFWQFQQQNDSENISAAEPSKKSSKKLQFVDGHDLYEI